MEQWRIAVLGDRGGGKTALAVQFTCNGFAEDHYRKQWVMDNRMCLLEVRTDWTSEVHRWSQGFILVYSIGSRSTFDHIETHHQSMRRVKGEHPAFILVGNKCDKTHEREVSEEEGAALARQLGCEFMETSAKTAHNVERAFTSVVKALRETAELPAALNHRRTGEKLKMKMKCMIL
ncbi:ras protein [Mycena galopus ATCC 62051]|nr:ras protein [Mycena galopus ATCC 62051]